MAPTPSDPRRWSSIIVHADMDAFYAAVEQLDDVTLRGKPVLIGPNSNRGVVLTASYEARPFGVGSAMPVAEARRRCPDAVMISPRFERYEAVSKKVMDIFADFSPRVEALSLDEAFLDMTGAEHFFGGPQEMGAAIKTAVLEETGLNISVGVSGTKYVAKVASAYDKPNGLTVVPQSEAVAWLAPLPVNRLWGVGRKTTPRLNDLGLHTIGDIAPADPNWLVCALGSLGTHIYQLAHARDPRRVHRGRQAKSIGSDRTLSQDVSKTEEIERHLHRAAERIARRLRGKSYVARGVRVRLKTTQHQLKSRQIQLTHTVDTADQLFKVAQDLLREFDHPGPFRLVGMAAFDLQWREQPAQLDLFENSQHRRLETTMDAVLKKFGKDTIVRARDLPGPNKAGTPGGNIADGGVNLDFLDYRDGERVSSPA